MTFPRVRFRVLLFFLFIGIATFGSIVGGLVEFLSDRLAFALTLVAVGKDLRLLNFLE